MPLALFLFVLLLMPTYGQANTGYPLVALANSCNLAQQAYLEGDLEQASKILTQVKEQLTHIEAAGGENPALEEQLGYCSRVEKDIMLAQATPRLKQGFALCDQAADALAIEELADAEILLRLHEKELDAAIRSDPSVENQFKTRRKISYCKGLQHELQRQRQLQQQVLNDFMKLLSEAKAIDQKCQEITDQYEHNTGSDDTSQFQAAVRKISQDQHRLKRNLEKQSSQIQATEHLEHQVRDLVNTSSRCLQSIREDVKTRASTLALLKQEFSSYQQVLRSALRTCQEIEMLDKGGEAQYEAVKKLYDRSTAQRNQVQAALDANWHYKRRPDWPVIQQVSDSLSALNTCLSEARLTLATLYSAQTSSIPDFPGEATEDGESGVPPSKITGSVRLMQSNAAFALIYLQDGSRLQENVTIVLDQNGFEQPLYTIAAGEQYRLHNKASQPLQVEILALGDAHSNGQSESLELAPGDQIARVMDGASNSIFRLSTGDMGTQPTYLVNLPSANYQVLPLNFESREQRFELNNPREASYSYLLIPGFEPTTLEVIKGKIKNGVIREKGQPQGNLLVKGE